MEELAQRSGLAIEQIERIENNIDLPSLAPLIKIARVLGVRDVYKRPQAQKESEVTTSENSKENAVIETIMSRRSVRKYKPQAVNRDRCV